MKHYLFASLTIVSLFVLALWDAPAWLTLGIAGLLLTPLVFHVDDLKRQIEFLEWSIEGGAELISDLDAMVERRNAEIRELQKSAGQFDQFLAEDNKRLAEDLKVMERRYEDIVVALEGLEKELTEELDDAKSRHANLCRNLQQEVDRAKKVFTYPKITPQTTDQEHLELVRMTVEEKLDWMYFILTKSLETPAQQEEHQIQREQETVYNNGLGL